MPVPHWIETFFLRASDAIFKHVPRKLPEPTALAACKIISHRGEHDNHTIFENTLPAFDTAAKAGVWGLECDLRWTVDLQPVIIHDPDLRRLFNDPTVIARTDFKSLRKRFPMIPTLEAVVEAFGGRHHLMLEIKKEPYPDPERQNRILGDIFASLTPGSDYHLLSLNPGMFDVITFAPREIFLPVAETNLPQLSRIALDKAYGGVNGHYAFMTRNRIRQHHQAGQKVGTGYAASRNVLYREINRGVTWVYSNCAARLVAMCF